MTIKKLLVYSGVILVIVAIILIASLVGVDRSVQIMEAAQSQRALSLLLADELRESSRDLTAAVRKFVVTGDEYYANEYMNVLKIRFGERPRPLDREVAPGQCVSLEELMVLAEYTESELSLLKQALDLSEGLAQIEIEAMNLAREALPDGDHYSVNAEPDKEKAMGLIFGSDYEIEVARIMAPFSLFKQELDLRLDDELAATQSNYNRSILFLWAAFAAVIIMFAVFLLLVALVIVRPVLICDRFARQIAAGNLSCPLDYTSKNELGSLAESLRFMLKSLLERFELQENMRYYSVIISAVDAGVVIKDEAGVVQEWNIGAENILGYKAEEIIGYTTKYYAPEEGHSAIDEMQRQLSGGEHTSHVDVVRKHKDGRLIDCSASYSPIFDDNGEFIGSVSIFHDVTAERLAEKKAKKLAAIVSAADAGIVVKDIDCNILEWNIGAENILGYKPEEIIGKNIKYCVPEEYHAEIDEIKKRLLGGEHTTHVEVVRKHKDGRLVYCSATYTPIFDENGQYIGSVTVFQDISYKKQIECALKEALRTAEEASKAKSIFLAHMSHEIRTPMNGVIGFAELVLSENNISDNIRDYLIKIKTSADSLLHIINDILDISKIEAGAMRLEKIPFELHDVFKDCEAVSSLKAAEKGITLYFYAEPFIERKLLGDPTKLRQVFINLLSNAIKFTNYGMVKLTAAVVEQKDDKVKIRIEVKDSGIGMTAEQIKNIFDPFVQADNSTTRKYGGTGLGLAITKSFIEMMGGQIEVESIPGVGSKFGFTLPFETVFKSKDGHRQNKYSDNSAKPVFVGEVLVCEDNPINQEVIKKHLSLVGLTSVIAANGEQGLAAVKARIRNGNLFDLILMDIHMPVMDGLETMRKLIESGNKTPVVALTANAMLTDKEKYLEQGMSDYLSKPFSSKELWSCLMRHLTPINFTGSSETANTVNDFSGTEAGQPLILTNVLNEKAGIERLLGDEQFYRRIQKNFYNDNKDASQRLEEAIDEGDMESAHRIAHTLKSSARLIGAEKLAQAAEMVELAFLGENPGCTTGQTEALESELRDVLTVIEQLLVEAEPKSEQTEEGLDWDSAAALIEKLSPLLKSSDPESVDFIDSVNKILSPLGDASVNLAHQIEDYDFDAAYETIGGIKTLLENKRDDSGIVIH